MDSECKEFTAPSWWPLIDWLTEQLHRRLGELRRDRGAFAEGRRLLFHGRVSAPALECVGWSHYNPQHRPVAWVSVDIRMGEPVGTDVSSRCVWEREIALQARLPEAHQRKIVEVTDWRCSDGRRRRVSLAPLALQKLVRGHGKHRLRDAAWRPPLIPPRVWIDPGATPRDVTRMALLLIFRQEGMVSFGPVDSTDAWAWVKGWTRRKDDAECFEVVTQMRQHYVCAEDWRALRVYLGKVCRGLRAARGDALAYARPLRDVVGGAGDGGLEVL